MRLIEVALMILTFGMFYYRFAVNDGNVGPGTFEVKNITHTNIRWLQSQDNTEDFPSEEFEEDFQEERLDENNEECEEGRRCFWAPRPGLGQVYVCTHQIRCGESGDEDNGDGDEQECQVTRLCSPVFRPGLGRITMCRNKLICA